MYDIQAGCHRRLGPPEFVEVYGEKWCDRCGKAATYKAIERGTEYTIETYYCNKHLEEEYGNGY